MEQRTMSQTSNRTLNVTVNGKPYRVEVGDLHTSPIVVKVNGQLYQVEVESAGVVQVAAAEPGAALDTVARQTTAPEKGPQPAGPMGVSVKVIKAPMPGHIVDIAVKPGDRVQRDQELCSLEAMKMKNAIRAPFEGTIASVAVTAGQPVAYGDTLMTFE
jgi:biotin carboxyl carrier protein